MKNVKRIISIALATMFIGIITFTAINAETKMRAQVVEKAMANVGKIYYSQARHGKNLADGDGNDCSGFVSQVLGLQKNYTTASFYTTFNPKKWDESIVKPGDIILHYTGNIADGKGDHALIYAGIDPNTGSPVSIDCSINGVNMRSRGIEYYEESYVISLPDVVKERRDL